MDQGIHPSSLVSSNATIGKNVQIGPFCIIHDGSDISDNCVIGAYCEIGIATPLAKTNRLVIGSNSEIRSHSRIYIGSVFGESLVTGHDVQIRENTVIGVGCRLGTRAIIEGDCSLGNHVNCHAEVHIGKGSEIGNYVWLFPEVLLTNDPTPPSHDLVGVKIDDFAVVAAKSLLMPGVKICRDAVVGAGSVVTMNVPEGKVVQGNPAKIVCDAKILRLHSDVRKKAYPWRLRFHRGYPSYVVKEWMGVDGSAPSS